MPKPIRRISAKQRFLRCFQRSRKGNLWQELPEFDGRNVTVFRRDDGFYSFVIADMDGPHFSSRKYQTERGAMLGLWEHLRPEFEQYEIDLYHAKVEA